MCLFLHQIQRKVVLHHLLTSGSSAVNGCRQSSVDYLWIIVMFLSAVWTLILTAPIHCRGSIAEQVMLHSPIHLKVFGWINVQETFIFGWTIPLRHQKCNPSKIPCFTHSKAASHVSSTEKSIQECTAMSSVKKWYINTCVNIHLLHYIPKRWIFLKDMLHNNCCVVLYLYS